MPCMTEEYGYLNYARTKLNEDALLVDVGINIGAFTEGFLKRFRKGNVIGFEPTKVIYEQTRNKFIGQNKIKIWNLAVGEKTQEVEFHLGGSAALECSSVYWRKKFSKKKTTVSMVSLDEFDLPPIIDYLKIDVEGAELSVLSGAKKTIEEKRIKFIQFEAGECYPLAGITLGDVIEFLQPNYNVYNEQFKVLPPNFDLPMKEGMVRNFLAELK